MASDIDIYKGQEWFIPGLGLVTVTNDGYTGRIAIEVEMYGSELEKVGVPVETIQCGCGYEGAAVPGDYKCLECRELEGNLDEGYGYMSDLPWLLDRAGLKKPT